MSSTGMSWGCIQHSSCLNSGSSLQSLHNVFWQKFSHQHQKIALQAVKLVTLRQKMNSDEEQQEEKFKSFQKVSS